MLDNEHLKQARLAHNLTQAQLGEKIGVRSSKISIKKLDLNNIRILVINGKKIIFHVHFLLVKKSGF